MSDLRIFGLELQNIIVIFEISSFEFAVMEKKCLNLIPKMPALCMLGLEFQKTIAMFQISTLAFV